MWNLFWDLELTHYTILLHLQPHGKYLADHLPNSSSHVIKSLVISSGHKRHFL